MDGWAAACTELRVGDRLQGYSCEGRLALSRCNRIAGAAPGKKRKLSSSFAAQKSELSFPSAGVGLLSGGYVVGKVKLISLAALETPAMQMIMGHNAVSTTALNVSKPVTGSGL